MWTLPLPESALSVPRDRLEIEETLSRALCLLHAAPRRCVRWRWRVAAPPQAVAWCLRRWHTRVLQRQKAV